MFWKKKDVVDRDALKKELLDEIKNEEQAELDAEEPWVDIRGEPDEQGKIRIEVDWNDAFITYLKENGFNGANEEVIIQQYLATIHRQLMEKQVGEGKFDG